MSRTLDEVLRSTWDVLYPGELCEMPVAIDSQSSEGDTPLHVMAWRQDVEAVEMLVRAGADVNAMGDMDETPLHVAIRNGNSAMVQMLLSAGARSDIRSEFGDTPQDMAKQRGGEIGKYFASGNDT